MNATFFDSNVSPVLSSALRSQPAIGTDEEIVQHAALLQIFKNLKECVRYQEALWNARDLALAKEMGREYRQVHIEIPTPDNFYAGPRPSLVESPVDFWPSITVRCNSGRSAPVNEQLDEIDVTYVDLFIEVLCKAGPVNQDELHELAGIETDGMVDAQVQRLTASVQACIALDKTLGGVIMRIDRPPTVKPSIPFSRPGTGPKGTGPYYVFQGKQLQYTIYKHSL